MGVKNLWKLLAPCGKRASIESKTLAVDTSIWMHQYRNMAVGTVLYSVVKRILKLIYNGARPVFVFDGAVPELKKATIELRKRDELKALLRGIVCNRRCRVCGKTLRECEHVNDFQAASFEEVNSAVSKRLEEHKYNWGEFSDEFLEDEDMTDVECKRKVLDGCSEVRQDGSISDFKPDSIRNLSKTRQLRKLIELRQKRRVPMQCDDSNCDRFSQSQIENVRKRNMVNTMIKELNDGARKRVLSDWSIQSELAKQPDPVPVQASIPHEESLESRIVEKTKVTTIDELFGKQIRETEWMPVYEEYGRKDQDVFRTTVESLIKLNTELAEEIRITHTVRPLYSWHALQPAIDGISGKSGCDSDRPSDGVVSNCMESTEEVLHSSDDSEHQMEALAELQESFTQKSKATQEYSVFPSSDLRGTKEMIKDVLTIFGIPFIESPGEADSQCSYLFKKGLIDGVISEDSDMIIYGTTVYKNFFRKDKDIEMFTLQSVQEVLGLCQDDMIKMSFLLGSDYCVGVRGIGIKKAVEGIRNVREDEVEFLRKIYRGSHAKDIERLVFGRLDAARLQRYLHKKGVEASRIEELMVYCQKMRELDT